MFALEWWVYPLIGGITFVSMWLAYRLEAWQESRRRGCGERPCLAHIGTQESGAELYCGRLDGHQGSHGGEVVVTFAEKTLVDVMGYRTTEDQPGQCEDLWWLDEDASSRCLLFDGHLGLHAYTEEDAAMMPEPNTY